MKARLYTIAAVALLLLAAGSAALWVRSFWVSDWVLMIHRHAPGRLTSVGAATMRGELAVYHASPNGSDHSDPRDTLFQFNGQRVGGVMVAPYQISGERWLGFGGHVSPDGRYREVVVPGWFVTAVTGLLGLLVLRRARRLRRAARIGLCAKCGYDLRASPDRCPECGTPAPAATASPPAGRTPGGPGAARLPSA